MCTRYALTLPPEVVRAAFGYIEQPNFPPRYNIAPTQPIAIVCRDPLAPGSAARHFRLVRWGFLPGFVKDVAGFPLLLNARAEGITEKPSFRAAMIRRRCLIVADGWYEWQRLARGGPGSPFLFRRGDRGAIGFAGLWESWLGADGSEIDTACIVTVGANAAAAAVHPRMPAVLAPADYGSWLDGDHMRRAEAMRLLRPAPDHQFTIMQVSPAVNKATTDEPSVQDPVRSGPALAPAPRQGSLF